MARHASGVVSHPTMTFRTGSPVFGHSPLDLLQPQSRFRHEIVDGIFHSKRAIRGTANQSAIPTTIAP